MRVEIVETRFLDGTVERVRGEVFVAKTTADEVKAQLWVALGWARDSDTGAQGERKPGPSSLSVVNVNVLP